MSLLLFFLDSKTSAETKLVDEATLGDGVRVGDDGVRVGDDVVQVGDGGFMMLSKSVIFLCFIRLLPGLASCSDSDEATIFFSNVSASA